MAQFVNDTFTESPSNVELSLHTGETGATWAKNSQFSQSLQVSASADNVAQSDTGVSSACYYASGTPAGNEYDVECDVTYASISNQANLGPAGRMSTTADTMYYARYNTGSTAWQLYKVVAGSYSLLGSYSQSLSTSTPYACKLEIRDAAKKVYIDATERISSADDVITADGKAGTRWSLNDEAAYAGRMDNFTADDAAAAGATIPIIAYHFNHNTGSHL